MLPLLLIALGQLPAALVWAALVGPLREDDACLSAAEGAASGSGPACGVGLLQQEARKRAEGSADERQLAPVMQAAVCTGFGGLERIHVQSVPRPRPGRGQALVEVAASSVNPIDWKTLPTFQGVLGRDFAGRVVSWVPPCSLEVGDLVWGDHLHGGAYGDYLAVGCGQLGLRPTGISAAEAGAMPHVALATLQALKDAGAPWATSPTVLVLGGSGGTGHVGIQLAKAFGAGKVITTTSPSHFDMVKSLGADQVIDYHTENWWQVTSAIDVIYDCVGEAGSGEHAYRVLRNGGTFVTLLPDQNVRASVVTAFARPQVRQVFSSLSDTSRASLDTLKGLVDKGQLKVIIGTAYNRSEVKQAFKDSREGKAVGKIAIRLRDE